MTQLTLEIYSFSNLILRKVDVAAFVGSGFALYTNAERTAVVLSPNVLRAQSKVHSAKVRGVSLEHNSTRVR